MGHHLRLSLHSKHRAETWSQHCTWSGISYTCRPSKLAFWGLLKGLTVLRDTLACGQTDLKRSQMDVSRFVGTPYGCWFPRSSDGNPGEHKGTSLQNKSINKLGRMSLSAIWKILTICLFVYYRYESLILELVPQLINGYILKEC